MKRIFKDFIPLVFAFLFIQGTLTAQDKSTVDWLSEYKGEVPTGSYTYKYAYSYFNKELCGITISTIKINKKGDESTSSIEVYLSDIDENAVKFKVTGKYLTVSLETKNSQKFIKSFDDGEFKGYINSSEILCDQVEKARSLVDAIKSHLKECTHQEKSWASLKDCVDWLSSNISKTPKGNTEYNQIFSADASKNYLSELTRIYNDSKGNEITEKYSWNMADINADKISLNVSGKDLSIELKTKDDNKYFKVVKSDVLQNYDNNLEIYVPDLVAARNMVQALKYATEQSKPVYKTYADVNLALNFLKENIKSVTSGNSELQQNFEFENKPDGMVTFGSSETDSKGITTEEKYQVYLNELNPAVDLNISGKEVTVKMNVKDKQKLVKVFKNSEQQNYSNQIEIYTDGIEPARELINALNYAILNRDAGIQKWADDSKAATWASANTGSITESGKTYKQKLTFDPSNNYMATLSLTSTDNNGDTEEKFVFYVSDIDKDNVDLSVSGKKMTVKISTGKEKLIKATKFDQIQNYESSIEVYFDDTKIARNFISALKFLASTVKSADKTLTDNAAAFKFIASSLHTVSTGTYTMDQTIEMVDNDPCKIKLSIVQIDSKNESTGYIYEFNLSDINADAVKLDISGKEMKVNLETKGKQKLIKPYKNSEPQNFAYGVDLYCDDVATARNIINAFKTLAKKCGK